MYTRRKIRWSIILRFAWKNLIIFTLWSALITAADVWLRSRGSSLGVPFLPLSTIGIAVAFYIGFKNAQSYDRLWEGRKIWGAIVNDSRAWANQVLSFVTDAHSETKLRPVKLNAITTRLVRRQLAWINALRIQLRATTIFDRKNMSHTPDFKLSNDRDCTQSISTHLEASEYRNLLDKANGATHLLRNQSADLKQLQEQGLIDDFRHMSMMDTIRSLYEHQGRCERIKNTPFPRQYAYFSAVFVWIFCLLLPFGLVYELGRVGHTSLIWLTVPFSVLISWIYSTIEIVGDNSEDPFENYINDVPMSAICRTIEIDLLQMLGEESVPPKREPKNDILL